MWIPLLCADTLRGTTFRRVVIARARWGSENQRVPLRVPSIVRRVPSDAGPLVVGSVLGLAVSPCSSPILVAVLAAAGSNGDPRRAVEAMVVYSIGYTSELWIASVFTGALPASQCLLRYGELIGRLSAAALGLLGLGGIVYGITLLT